MKQNFKNLRHCFVTTPIFIFVNGCQNIAAKIWLGKVFLIKSETSLSKALFSMINNTNTPFLYLSDLNSHFINVFLFAMLTIKTKKNMHRSRYVNKFYNKQSFFVITVTKEICPKCFKTNF